MQRSLVRVQLLFPQLLLAVYFAKTGKNFLYIIERKNEMTKFVVDTHDCKTRRDGRGFGKHDKDRHKHRVI